MIYKFRPIFKSTIWGGDEIARFKGITLQEDNIGESWEISGVKGNLSVVDGCTDVLRKGHTALISADTESTAIKALANEAKVLIAYIG
ncbi:MAG: hypothetical protein K2I39_05460 [Muribaculaceae bacterium]|nr:hypothetical protein [Muribaculaceae bacterium]